MLPFCRAWGTLLGVFVLMASVGRAADSAIDRQMAAVAGEITQRRQSVADDTRALQSLADALQALQAEYEQLDGQLQNSIGQVTAERGQVLNNLNGRAQRLRNPRYANRDADVRAQDRDSARLQQLDQALQGMEQRRQKLAATANARAAQLKAQAGPILTRIQANEQALAGLAVQYRQLEQARRDQQDGQSPSVQPAPPPVPEPTPPKEPDVPQPAPDGLFTASKEPNGATPPPDGLFTAPKGADVPPSPSPAAPAPTQQADADELRVKMEALQKELDALKTRNAEAERARVLELQQRIDDLRREAERRREAAAQAERERLAQAKQSAEEQERRELQASSERAWLIGGIAGCFLIIALSGAGVMAIVLWNNGGRRPVSRQGCKSTRRAAPARAAVPVSTLTPSVRRVSGVGPSPAPAKRITRPLMPRR